MIAAERFSSQYRSKLNRLFTILLIHVLFPLRPKSSRGDMVQSNLLNPVHLHLNSEDHCKYGRMFSTHESFPLIIQSTLRSFSLIRPPQISQNASLKIAVVGIALSVNIKHTYTVTFRISSSKMQLKFVVTEHKFAQNY